MFLEIPYSLLSFEPPARRRYRAGRRDQGWAVPFPHHTVTLHATHFSVVVDPLQRQGRAAAFFPFGVEFSWLFWGDVDVCVKKTGTSSGFTPARLVKVDKRSCFGDILLFQVSVFCCGRMNCRVM